MNTHQYALLITITVLVCLIWSHYNIEPSKVLPGNQTVPDRQNTTATYKSILEPSPTPNQPATKEDKPIAAPGTPLGYVSSYGALPKSLKGTHIDSQLDIDPHGDLIITEDIKSIFDYFFSTLGEESMDLIISRIKEYLHFKLSEPALSQSLTILNNYTQYQAALDTLSDNGASSISLAFYQDTDTLNQLKNKLEQIKDIRRQYLSHEVVHAFFHEDEAYDGFTIERLLIEQDPSLSILQKQNLVDQLKNRLPSSLVKTQDLVTKPSRLIQETNNIRQRGGNEQEVRTLRESMYNTKVAERLEKLDIKRAEWKNRFDAYQSTKRTILNNERLTKNQQQFQIQQLLDQNFNKTEQIRVNALESLNKF